MAPGEARLGSAGLRRRCEPSNEHSRALERAGPGISPALCGWGSGRRQRGGVWRRTFVSVQAETWSHAFLPPALPPPPPAGARPRNNTICAPGRGSGRGVGEEEGGSVTSGHVSALIAPGRSLSRPPTTDDQDKDQVVSHGNWLVFTFTLQHQQQQHGYTQGAAMALTARGTTTLPPYLPPGPEEVLRTALLGQPEGN